MRILVAEDDVTSRAVVRSLLEKWDFEVIMAQDGDEAWQCVSCENAPDIILLDWMMPGLNGIEVCKKIRNELWGIQPFIIVFTTKADQDDIHVALDAGADDYISKPFVPGELRIRLQLGKRIIQLQEDLTSTTHELQAALALRESSDDDERAA